MSYIDGSEPTDAYTKELDRAVWEVKSNEKWRLDYMTLEMKYSEIRKEGQEEGREEGRIQMAINLYVANKILAKDAAEILGVTEKEFLTMVKEYQK